jgi:uncharacterized protein (TIGR03067 family)
VKKYLWLFVAAPLLLPPFVCGLGEKKGDLDLAQGTWVVVSVEADGKPFNKEQVEQIKSWDLVITGNKVVVKIPPEKLKRKEAPTISFKIDPMTKPKSVDIKVQEGDSEYNYNGIYSLEGDKLTICIGLGKDPVGKNSERPTEFTTKENSNRMLGQFKRKVK